MAISRPKQVSNQNVSALHVDSSVTALVVHSVDASGAYVSPGAGSTQVSVKEILTSSGASIMDSTNNSIGVTIRAGSAAGTEYTDGDTDATPNGGVIFFHNSSNTMRAVSAATPLPVSGTFSASTTVNVSSLAGAVTVRSSKADALVTVYQSTYTDLLARVFQGVGNSSGADAWLFAVTDSSNAVVKPGDGANSAIRVNVVAGAAGGSTQVSVKEILTSSGGSVMDGTNVAIRVNVVAGSAAGSTEITVRQSTYTDFNTLSRIADRDQSTQVAGVLNGAPASTVWALAVRQVGFVAPSTTIQVSSLAGKVTVDQNSTVWQVQVSSLAGKVLVDQNSTVWQAQISTVQGRVLVDQNSTVWQVQCASLAGVVMTRIQDSSGVGIAGSTGPTAVGVNGLVTREVMPTLQSTTILITSTASTALYTLISSAAGLRQKVYAYFVGSTHTSPSTMIFWSSNAIDRWHVNFGSGSSGITGANMALSPPAWIFHGDVANAVRVSIEGGSSAASTVIARVSLGYFSEA